MFLKIVVKCFDLLQEAIRFTMKKIMFTVKIYILYFYK